MRKACSSREITQKLIKNHKIMSWFKKPTRNVKREQNTQNNMDTNEIKSAKHQAKMELKQY